MESSALTVKTWATRRPLQELLETQPRHSQSEAAAPLPSLPPHLIMCHCHTKRCSQTLIRYCVVDPTQKRSYRWIVSYRTNVCKHWIGQQTVRPQKIKCMTNKQFIELWFSESYTRRGIHISSVDRTSRHPHHISNTKIKGCQQIIIVSGVGTTPHLWWHSQKLLSPMCSAVLASDTGRLFRTA